MFLTAAEVQRLTGKVRFSAQRRVLDGLGIRYVLAATGEPMVRSADLDDPGTKERNGEPHWDRIAG